MLIAFSEFLMRPLCGIDQRGNFKLPTGMKKASDNKTLELRENIDNWRKGKHKPRGSTLSAMRNGDFGEAGKFIISVSNAIKSRNIAELSKRLNDDLDRVYEGFNEGLALVHAIDSIITEYLVAGDAQALETANLPESLKARVKDFRTSGKLCPDPEARCCFYLYFWYCIESRFPSGLQKPFQSIFKREGASLYASFVKIIRAGIRKHGHKMLEIHRLLKMDYKKFDDVLRTPSRFCNPDFLSRFASAYYDLCFSGKLKKPQDANVLFAVWNTVAHAVWTMDKAKKIWNIDFRVLSNEYYDSFATIAAF